MIREDIDMPTWEMSVTDNGNRVEISSLSHDASFDLHLSETVIQQIRQIEESAVTAEQRVGMFRVG